MHLHPTQQHARRRSTRIPTPVRTANRNWRSPWPAPLEMAAAPFACSASPALASGAAALAAAGGCRSSACGRVPSGRPAGWVRRSTAALWRRPCRSEELASLLAASPLRAREGGVAGGGRVGFERPSAGRASRARLRLRSRRPPGAAFASLRPRPAAAHDSPTRPPAVAAAPRWRGPLRCLRRPCGVPEWSLDPEAQTGRRRSRQPPTPDYAAGSTNPATGTTSAPGWHRRLPEPSTRGGSPASGAACCWLVRLTRIRSCSRLPTMAKRKPKPPPTGRIRCPRCNRVHDGSHAQRSVRVAVCSACSNSTRTPTRSNDTPSTAADQEDPK